MTKRLVIIGGSAGSLEVLLQVIPALKRSESISIVIVVHRKDFQDSLLLDLLTSRTKIPMKEIEDKEKLLVGHIYIAPANYHVLFENRDAMSLDYSEKVNFSRPSIDVTFESAAEAFGKEAIAILLSGSNSDGAAGLKAIHGGGGISIVQSPESAVFPYMPEQAMLSGAVDHVFDPMAMVAYINGI